MAAAPWLPIAASGPLFREGPGPSVEDRMAGLVTEAVVSRLQAQLTRMEQQLNLLSERSVLQTGAVPLTKEPSGWNLGVLSSRQLNGRAATSPSEKALLLDNRELQVSEDDEEGYSCDSSEREQRFLSELPWYHRLDHTFKRCRGLKEPPRTGRLAMLVESDAFSQVTFVVILLNCVFISCTTTYTAKTLNQELTGALHLCEQSFLLFYLLELTLRLIVHRLYFFCNNDWGWNTFDFLIVFLGATEQIVRHATNHKVSFDVTFLRMSRILRITKILRIFKAFRFLSELRLMGSCVIGSFVSLFWACSFLVVVLWVAALVMVQSMSQFRMDHCKQLDVSTGENCKDVKENFGSVTSAMLALFMSTTGGRDWMEVFDLVKEGGLTIAGSFLFFIIFFNFAFFNIVTSMFVDKAMKFAKPDEEAQLVERTQEEEDAKIQLRNLIAKVDCDNSGEITLDELRMAMKDHKVLHKFDMLGITVRDVQTFFATLKDNAGTEQLTVDLFLDGCMKMKGPANSLDVQTIRFQVQEILRMVRPRDSPSSPFSRQCSSRA